MIRRTVLFCITLLGMCALWGDSHVAAGTPAAQKHASQAVTINNFSFGPQTLSVAPGTTVVWTNRDDEPHTVTSTDKVFASPVLDTGEKFEFTFRKPGTYPYFCSIHPTMTGKVLVQ